MQKRTTPLSRKRPHMRRAKGTTGYQLPRGRTRSRQRPGATYLKHSQGFGGSNRLSRASRVHRSTMDPRRRSRRSFALVIVGCAALFFVASLIWYANRSVEITLNGEPAKVTISSTIAQLIENEGLDEAVSPGDLLAVDDSVLERDGGARYTVVLNGTEVAEADLDVVELTGGEEVEITDGADVYEEHDVKATTIQPTLTVDGNGAFGYVRTWGIPGRSEVWTGKESGIVQDRGVVQEVQNCEVAYRSITPADGDYVALTFDEGPSSHTQEILDVLEEKDVSATFFMQGTAVDANPAAAKAIVDAGHEVGSNAYDDTLLSDLTTDEMRSEVTRGFDAIEQATGTRPVLLRAPYAEFSAENWMGGMDLVSAVVSWNVDSGDWLLPGADAVVTNVMGSVRSGNVVLFTDSEVAGGETAEALGTLIDQLQAEGYKIVTLSELVATDKELAEELKLSAVTMPEDAVLPAHITADEDTAA